MSDTPEADEVLIDHYLRTLRAVKDQQLLTYSHIEAEHPEDDRLSLLLDLLNERWADFSAPMAVRLGIHSSEAPAKTSVEDNPSVATVGDVRAWLAPYADDVEVELDFSANGRIVWATLRQLNAWSEPDGKPCLSLGVEDVMAELFGAEDEDGVA